MEVPRVDRDPSGVRIPDQVLDLRLVGLRLGEGVVEDDVHIVLDRTPGIELGHHDPVTVGLEQVRDPDHQHVVVVDEGNQNRIF